MHTTKPEWLKIRPATAGSEEDRTFKQLRQKIKKLPIATVCQEAHCPNMAECWSEGTATFMVMGDTCTRGCRFCNIKTAIKGQELNPYEPMLLAQSIKEMDLNYAVVTSVDRDDLEDGGAGHFARCIKAIQKVSPKTLVEVLIPDFNGDTALHDIIIEAKPTVIAQNIETVRRLTRSIRDPRAGYEQTMNVLKYIKEASPETFTKSSIIVGMGETEDEVIETLKDLRASKVDFVTLGQYLRPTDRHHELVEYVKPEVFKKYETIALELGFLYAFSGPFVRSSYKAGEYFESLDH